MKRFVFLDWMRGLAVIIMIQCHAFNSFVRIDLRGGSAYRLSQYIGGMAAPLFLFMAGMTLAFQMDSLERREPRRFGRWLASLRRAGYVLGIAYLFRLTGWAGSWPHGTLQEIFKVDILNCMGLGMAALSAMALFRSGARAQMAAAAGFAIAAASPIMAGLDWSGVPALVHAYLAPGQGKGLFAFFPCAAYVAFGIATGTVVKRTPPESIERLMQWCVPAGFVLALGAEYFAEVPYSVYSNSHFWTDSPALILIRTGICLCLMAVAYAWTEFCAPASGSPILVMGKASLLVYWVHVMIVYGGWASPIKRALDIPQTALATCLVVALMTGLASARLRWPALRARIHRSGAAPSPVSTAADTPLS